MPTKISSSGIDSSVQPALVPGVTMKTLDGVSQLGSGNTALPYSFRNRIINGDMRIDQRNAGGAVTQSSSVNTFPVDRFFGWELVERY